MHQSHVCCVWLVLCRHISFEVRAGRVAALLRSATRVPLLEVGAADIKLGLGTQVSICALLPGSHDVHQTCWDLSKPGLGRLHKGPQ
jgi:hypothetical protein